MRARRLIAKPPGSFFLFPNSMAMFLKDLHALYLVICFTSGGYYAINNTVSIQENQINYRRRKA